MVHGKTMSSWRLGTLEAKPPPQSSQLAAKESIMEEHKPKEKWHSVSTLLGGRCSFLHIVTFVHCIFSVQ